MTKLFYLSFLLVGFISCKTETKSKSKILENSKSEKIDNLANRYLELNCLSGVIYVIKDDTIIYNRDFGLADYKNNKPFSNKTTFNISKISELVTANIIGQMAKNDKFKLSDKISKYIPEIESDLIIDNLLNHKTNLASLQSIQEQNQELEYSTIDYTNLAIQSSHKSERSDLNYNILRLLIEKISGKSYQENIENYSTALSLKNTYF